MAGGYAAYNYLGSKQAKAGEHPAANKPGGPTASAGPETVLSVTPANGATGINGAGQITVVFSKPLSPSSPLPKLHPRKPGTWHISGAAATFTPVRGFTASTRVTITIPAGPTGVRSTGNGTLATAVVVRFRTGPFSQVRVEQALAQLGYLPLTWAPTSGTASPLTDVNAQLSAAYSPPQGTYTWQPGWPAALHAFWQPDHPSMILKGAIMAFEADHGLYPLDGVAGHAVWKALFKALALGQRNTHGYSYAYVSQKVPETLTVWHNGVLVFHHVANTGISIRPTAVETDPVYIRLRYQIMKGRNPDGSKYADPVWWVAYFHNGEAVHYFPRGSYGSPQSLGCVELPYTQAKTVWPYLTYGTLVTVGAP